MEEEIKKVIEQESTYDASNIEVLEGLEAVRSRQVLPSHSFGCVLPMCCSCTQSLPMVL